MLALVRRLMRPDLYVTSLTQIKGSQLPHKSAVRRGEQSCGGRNSLEEEKAVEKPVKMAASLQPAARLGCHITLCCISRQLQ